MLNSTDPEQTQKLIDDAQQLLSTAWQVPVRLRMHDLIRGWGRHTLLRCRVKEGPDDAPHFVIVKAANEPDQDVGFERAGLQLLAELPTVRDLVPAVYAVDEADRMLVLEDLGDGPLVSQLLQARADWAEQALLESMRGLAVAHAATRGRQDRYLELYGRASNDVSTVGSPYGGAGDFPRLERIMAAALATVGLDEQLVPSGELRDAATLLAPPAQLRCLTFLDQCPSNRMVVDGRMRFMDLERVAFRHPFTDAVYPLLGHIKCMHGLRLGDGVRQRMLAEYRAGVADAYPEWADEGPYAQQMAAACVFQLLAHLHRQLEPALERDGTVGHFAIRRRQRLLAVVDDFLAAAESLDQLPRTREVVGRVRTRLSDQWRDGVVPLPLFPVFARMEPPSTVMPG